MKTARRRIDVNLEELDRVLDGARHAPLSDEDHDKLKGALHALVAMLARSPNNEKTSAVLGKPEHAATSGGAQPDANGTKKPGHGRNGAEAFDGARKVPIAHQNLKHGERCPDCEKGNVYGQKEPKVLVRIIGQAPLTATVYSLERLRCGACGQVFTAQEPEGVGPEKYDETAGAMIAQLKYGSGVPFTPVGKTGKPVGYSVAGGDTVGDCRRGCRGDQTGVRGVDPASGTGRGDAQRRHDHAGSQDGARARRRPHRRVHQRYRVDPRGRQDCAVFHRAPACR